MLFCGALCWSGWALDQFPHLRERHQPYDPVIVRAVLGGAVGPALIPVLKATGVAELLWAVGLAVGLAVG